jgi:hypothetical protein
MRSLVSTTLAGMFLLTIFAAGCSQNSGPGASQLTSINKRSDKPQAGGVKPMPAIPPPPPPPPK